MEDEIKIEDVKRLVVHPGELLVITISGDYPAEAVQRVSAFLHGYFQARGVETLVLTGIQGKDIQVVAKEALPV
jgi:hypothetical protein